MQLKQSRIIIVLIILVFLLGFLLRSVELINRNFLFGFDQGRDYLLVSQMVEEHKPRLIGAEVGAGSAGLSGIFHGPGYLYLLSIFYVLFKGDPYGGMVLMWIAGMLTLVFNYILFKRIIGKAGALISTFLIAISSNIVPQSRFIWNHHLSSLFIVITYYFVWLIPSRPSIYLPLSLFTAGSVYHFELAISVPLVISILYYTVFVLKIRKVKVWIFACIALAVSFLPMVAFELRHQAQGFLGIFNYIMHNNLQKETLLFYLFIFRDHIVSYWNNFESTFLTAKPFNNIVIDFMILFLFLWFVHQIFFKKNIKKNTFLKKYRLFIYFLLLSAILSFIFFLFLKNTIWDYYLIHLHFSYIYLFTLLVLYIFSTRKKLGKYLIVFLFTVMLFSAAQRIYLDYKHDYFDYGGGAKIKGKIDAVDFVYKSADGKPFNALVFMPPVYTYPYDYLFKWYGKAHYGYLPGNEKKDDLYLIIEVDGAKPWSYEGWLETVIVSGKVEWTETLPSGIIIQKRTFDDKNKTEN